VLGQFATGLLHQLLKRDPFLGETPLQSPFA